MYCHEKQNGGGELYTYCFVWNVSRIQISRFVCTSGLERGGGEYLCVVILTEEISVQSELGRFLLILMEGQFFGKKWTLLHDNPTLKNHGFSGQKV